MDPIQRIGEEVSARSMLMRYQNGKQDARAMVPARIAGNRQSFRYKYEPPAPPSNNPKKFPPPKTIATVVAAYMVQSENM
mmetsp:Transcript_14573/g.33004  ORF Transcript_14573/g.33004 Transcript_14573/m.33004 type:complete len:80 (+) Transcript_14573:458-697(+)